MKRKGSPLRPLELPCAGRGGLGWAWGLILILGTALTLERGDRTAYPAGEPQDAFEAHHPIYRELLSPSGTSLQGHGTCYDMWFNDDAVLIRGIGPMERLHCPFLVDHDGWWSGLCWQSYGGLVARNRAGTGGLDSSYNYTVGDNLRLVERAPPPLLGRKVGGLYVRASASSAVRSPKMLRGHWTVSNRLPAQRSINIGLLGELVGDFVPLAADLALDGRVRRRSSRANSRATTTGPNEMGVTNSRSEEPTLPMPASDWSPLAPLHGRGGLGCAHRRIMRTT